MGAIIHPGAFAGMTGPMRAAYVATYREVADPHASGSGGVPMPVHAKAHRAGLAAAAKARAAHVARAATEQAAAVDDLIAHTNAKVAAAPKPAPRRTAPRPAVADLSRALGVRSDPKLDDDDAPEIQHDPANPTKCKCAACEKAREKEEKMESTLPKETLKLIAQAVASFAGSAEEKEALRVRLVAANVATRNMTGEQVAATIVARRGGQ